MAKTLIKFGIKSAIAVSAIYWTRDQNVWGNSIATEKLYNQISNEIDPYLNKVRQQIPFELPPLPTSGQIGYMTNYYYNCGVKSTFHFIHMMPCYLGRWAKQGQDAISKGLEAPPPKAQKNEIH